MTFALLSVLPWMVAALGGCGIRLCGIGCGIVVAALKRH